jgi:hypothetical protein
VLVTPATQVSSRVPHDFTVIYSRFHASGYEACLRRATFVALSFEDRVQVEETKVVCSSLSYNGFRGAKSSADLINPVPPIRRFYTRVGVFRAQA